MSTAALIIGFVASTIGFSLFLYGKKQQRPPQLVSGLLLMICPMIAPGAAWSATIACALVAGLWLALRADW